MANVKKAKLPRPVQSKKTRTNEKQSEPTINIDQVNLGDAISEKLSSNQITRAISQFSGLAALDEVRMKFNDIVENLTPDISFFQKKEDTFKEDVEKNQKDIDQMFWTEYAEKFDMRLAGIDSHLFELVGPGGRIMQAIIELKSIKNILMEEAKLSSKRKRDAMINKVEAEEKTITDQLMAAQQAQRGDDDPTEGLVPEKETAVSKLQKIKEMFVSGFIEPLGMLGTGLKAIGTFILAKFIKLPLLIFGAVTLVYDFFDSILNASKNAEKLGLDGDNLFERVIGAVTKLIFGIEGSVGNAILKGAQGAAIGAIFGLPGIIIGGIIGAITGSIGGERFLQAIDDAWQGTVDVVTFIFDKIGEGITWLRDIFAVVLEPLGSGIVLGISAYVKAVVSFAEMMWDVGKFVARNVSNIYQGIIDIWTSVSDYISNFSYKQLLPDFIVNAIEGRPLFGDVNIVDSIVTSVTDMFAELFEGIKQSVKNLIPSFEGVGDTISSIGDRIYNAVAGDDQERTNLKQTQRQLDLNQNITDSLLTKSIDRMERLQTPIPQPAPVVISSPRSYNNHVNNIRGGSTTFVAPKSTRNRETTFSGMID